MALWYTGTYPLPNNGDRQKVKQLEKGQFAPGAAYRPSFDTE